MRIFVEKRDFFYLEKRTLYLVYREERFLPILSIEEKDSFSLEKKSRCILSIGKKNSFSLQRRCLSLFFL